MFEGVQPHHHKSWCEKIATLLAHYSEGIRLTLAGPAVIECEMRKGAGIVMGITFAGGEQLRPVAFEVDERTSKLKVRASPMTRQEFTIAKLLPKDLAGTSWSLSVPRELLAHDGISLERLISILLGLDSTVSGKSWNQVFRAALAVEDRQHALESDMSSVAIFGSW